MTTNSEIDRDRTAARWIQSGYYAISIVFNVFAVPSTLAHILLPNVSN